jgi:hypothetical protein
MAVVFVSWLIGELDGEEDGLANTDVVIDGDDESDILGLSDGVVVINGNNDGTGGSV